MKTMFQFSRLLTVTFCLAVTTSLFISCQKEAFVDPTAEEPAAWNKEADVIAYYTPMKAILFVNPAYLEQALEITGAHPGSDGRYTGRGITPEGKPLEIKFEVQPVPEEKLFEIAASEDAVQLPVLVNEFSANGTSYKVYRNAECGQQQAAFNGPCDNLSDGTSTHNEWLAIRKCGPGNGFCTEARLLGGYRHAFEFKDCQGPKKSSEPYYIYQCWQ